MEEKLNETVFTHTPHHSLRIFIPIDKIKVSDILFKLLDDMSIWGGCDSKSDIYYSWEFDLKEVRFCEKMCNLMNGE